MSDQQAVDALIATMQAQLETVGTLFAARVMLDQAAGIIEKLQAMRQVSHMSHETPQGT